MIMRIVRVREILLFGDTSQRCQIGRFIANWAIFGGPTATKKVYWRLVANWAIWVGD